MILVDRVQVIKDNTKTSIGRIKISIKLIIRIEMRQEQRVFEVCL